MMRAWPVLVIAYCDAYTHVYKSDPVAKASRHYSQSIKSTSPKHQSGITVHTHAPSATMRLSQSTRAWRGSRL